MANKDHTLVPAFELVRQIQYGNVSAAQWGPTYYSEDKNAIIQQIWDDIKDLTQRHVDSKQTCKMSFELNDNPTASFTFWETADKPNTITWRVENRVRIID
jgi:hypothetical protein